MKTEIFLLSFFAAFSAGDETSEFIIGGSDAILGQFKHMASIRYQRSPESPPAHGCGGGVINSRWVLTVSKSE